MKEVLRQLPLVLAYEQTRPAWGEFDNRQRTFALLATAMSVGRVGCRLATEVAYDKDRISRRQAAAIHVVLDVIDKADGMTARHGSAVTPWGQVLDPLMDKADFFIQEAARAHRGEIARGTVIIRLARDIFSTYTRQQEAQYADKAGDTPHTAATKYGKASTLVRTVANRTSDMWPHSRGARVLEHVATMGLALTALKNAKTYRR